MFIAFVAFACAKPLPVERPADLSVRYSDGGGMTQYRADERCDANGCVVDNVDAEGASTYLTGKASAADLDAFWTALRALHPERIKVKAAGPIYDAPSTSVTISGGGHVWSFQTGYSSELVPSSEASAQAVIAAIEGLVLKSATTPGVRPTP